MSSALRARTLLDAGRTEAVGRLTFLDKVVFPPVTAYKQKFEFIILSQRNQHAPCSESFLVLSLTLQPQSPVMCVPVYTAAYVQADQMFGQHTAKSPDFTHSWGTFLPTFHCPILCLADFTFFSTLLLGTKIDI